MPKRKSPVVWQDGSTDPYFINEHDVRTSKKAYHEFMEENTPFGRNSDGEFQEATSANPDVMSDEDIQDPALSARFEEMEHIRQEAYGQLSDKQQEAWDLVMRDGMSIADAAEELGITKASLADRINGAKAIFTTYCREQAGRLDGNEE